MKKAFTLIELLVVIAIIGILAGMILVSVTTARAKSRDVTRKSDLNQVAKALEIYYTDNEKYPIVNNLPYRGMDMSIGNASGSDWRDGTSTLKTFITPNYIKKLPIDPINDDYHFYFFNVVNNYIEPSVNLDYIYTQLNGKYFQLLTKLENGNDPNSAYKNSKKVFATSMVCNYDVGIAPPGQKWCVNEVTGKLIEWSVSDSSFPEGFLTDPKHYSDYLYLSGDLNELKKIYVVRNGM